MELFDFYTHSNCHLECAWRYKCIFEAIIFSHGDPIVFRRAEEVCGCKPWHIPAIDGTQTCFILGNICFDQIMSKIETGKMDLSCDCEPDCVVSR